MSTSEIERISLNIIINLFFYEMILYVLYPCPASSLTALTISTLPDIRMGDLIPEYLIRERHEILQVFWTKVSAS